MEGGREGEREGGKDEKEGEGRRRGRKGRGRGRREFHTTHSTTSHSDQQTLAYRLPELDLVDFDATQLVFEVLVELEGVCVGNLLALGRLQEHSCLPQ